MRPFIVRFLLTASIMLAGTAVLYKWTIAPLQQQEAECQREIDALRDQVRVAQDELCDIKEHEQTGGQFRRALNSLHDGTPVGPAVTWLPPRMKTHLGKVGIEQAVIRLNSREPEPKLIGYDRTYWHVSLPPQQAMRRMTDALLATAQIEQHDRFLKIVDFSFHCDPQAEVSPAGHVNVMAFVRK